MVRRRDGQTKRWNFKRKAKIIRLGKLLRDSGGSRNNNDKHSQRVRYEYDKYKEFYADFGGKDPIG